MLKRYDIRKTTIACNKKYYDQLIYELARKKIIHLEPKQKRVREDEFIDGEKTRELLSRNTIKNLEALIPLLGYNKKEFTKPLKRFNIYITITATELDENDTTIASILHHIREYNEKITEIKDKINAYKKEISELEEIKKTGISFNVQDILEYSNVIFGKKKQDFDRSLLAALDEAVIKQSGKYILLFYRKEASPPPPGSPLAQLIAGIDTITIDSSIETMTIRLNAKLDRLQYEKDDVTFTFNLNRRIWKKKILRIYRTYSLYLTTMESRKMFTFTRNCLVLEGWIDLNNAEKLEAILKKVCGNNFHLSIASKSEMMQYRNQTPVIMRNLFIFKPFEYLVQYFGIPANTEIDPTPFAAISFVVMFGVMFGDIGQGAVLVLAGFLMHLKARKKKILKGFMAQGGIILVYAGCSSILFGFLYGSIFGNEHLIKPLWLSPFEHIMELFFFTILMGVIIIATGTILKILNMLYNKNYFDVLFHLSGLPGLTIYLGSVFIIISFINKHSIPSQKTIVLVYIVPLTVFLFRNLLAVIFMRLKKPFPHGLTEYIIESLIEVIETIAHFLGNTVSFIRAGAFALSHAGLGNAVYALASVMDPGYRSPGALLVIVIGNIFIIVLEGLVCSIQSLRLEYYEFFGKFYKGDGREFKPFSLHTLHTNHGGHK